MIDIIPLYYSKDFRVVPHHRLLILSSFYNFGGFYHLSYFHLMTKHLGVYIQSMPLTIIKFLTCYLFLDVLLFCLCCK